MKSYRFGFRSHRDFFVGAEDCFPYCLSGSCGSAWFLTEIWSSVVCFKVLSGFWSGFLRSDLVLKWDRICHTGITLKRNFSPRIPRLFFFVIKGLTSIYIYRHIYIIIFYISWKRYLVIGTGGGGGMYRENIYVRSRLRFPTSLCSTNWFCAERELCHNPGCVWSATLFNKKMQGSIFYIFSPRG